MSITAHLAVRPTHVFRGNDFWERRNRVSEFAGLAFGILLCKIGVIILEDATDKLAVLPLSLSLASALPIYLLLFWGNYLARYPHRVIIEEGRGVWLYGSHRPIYVPVENLLDVRQGWVSVVRFKRRQRLLGAFLIPWTYSGETNQLVETIRSEIQKRESSSHPTSVSHRAPKTSVSTVIGSPTRK